MTRLAYALETLVGFVVLVILASPRTWDHK
jgi:hypothetical protein